MTRAKRSSLAFLLCAAGVARTPTLSAADLSQKAVAAFDRYILLTERRLERAGMPFLWLESLPARRRDTMLRSLRDGELIVDTLKTTDGNQEIDADHAVIHHWIGVVFVPSVNLGAAVALLQNYDRHQDIYQPYVAASRVLFRDSDHFRIQLRFVMKKILTVVVNSEHDAQFAHDGPNRASSRIRATRIAEVEDVGTAAERELPVGHGNGYLWRLNSYWRFLERDGGVYIQCETISLARDVPTGLGWLIRPLVTSIPRETLTFTLETTRAALAARQP